MAQRFAADKKAPMDIRQHWQTVYEGRDVSTVSWFQPHLTSSLTEIAWAVAAQGLKPEGARILDVGGGASTLVDDLLELGYREITVLDVAQSALAVSQRRLGDRANSVQWICDDLLLCDRLPEKVHLWHDRAVFHFLCDPEMRARYVDLVRKTLAVGSHLIVFSFGPDGPQRCSGLPAMRYSREALASVFDEGFVMVRDQLETHRTPAGVDQQFLLAHFLRTE